MLQERRRALRCLLAAGFSAAALAASADARADAAALAFSELYRERTVRGLSPSEKLLALDGKPVTMLGYLAPPLKPDVRFFVLTRAPVALCPFCNSDADWPSDIVVVYPKARIAWTQDGLPVRVTGRLQVGSEIDRETGFVSFVRVVDAAVLALP